MRSDEQAVIDWIRAAAERIPVEQANPVVKSSSAGLLEPTDEVVLVDVADRHEHRRRRVDVVFVAASVLVIAAIGVAMMAAGDHSVRGASQPAFDDPSAVPNGAPEPGTVLPHVEQVPAWFGTPIGAERSGGARTGRWTTAAIGIEDDTVTTPIVISVTDGGFRWLDSAETMTLNGQTIRLVELNGFSVLATATSPTVLVSGAASQNLLMEVLRATRPEDRGDHLSLDLEVLPSGYSVLVQPQVQAADPPVRPTLTNDAGDIVINEVSDWVDPELSAANSGADYISVVIAGQAGWAGYAEFNPYGPVMFLVWSPQPGVVLEITTTNGARSIADLTELAEATSVIPASEWHGLYD